MTWSVKGKPTLESQCAPVAVSSSEEEESLLTDPHPSFACIKNKNTALKGFLTFGVSNFLHVHFHRKFWFISVR